MQIPPKHQEGKQSQQSQHRPHERAELAADREIYDLGDWDIIDDLDEIVIALSVGCLDEVALSIGVCIHVGPDQLGAGVLGEMLGRSILFLDIFGGNRGSEVDVLYMLDCGGAAGDEGVWGVEVHFSDVFGCFVRMSWGRK